jgi:hypothetical protein
VKNGLAGADDDVEQVTPRRAVGAGRACAIIARVNDHSELVMGAFARLLVAQGQGQVGVDHMRSGCVVSSASGAFGVRRVERSADAFGPSVGSALEPSWAAQRFRQRKEGIEHPAGRSGRPASGHSLALVIELRRVPCITRLT